MNKKEQAAFTELQEQLRLAKALRWTEPVSADIEPPKSITQERLRKGWLYNGYIGGYGSSGRVDRACTSCSSHSFGNDDKTTTQRPRWLYSTKLRALKAMRHDIENQVAKILANIDEQIEEESTSSAQAERQPS